MRSFILFLGITLVLNACGSSSPSQLSPGSTPASTPGQQKQGSICDGIELEEAQKLLQEQSHSDREALLSGCDKGSIACLQPLEQFFLSQKRRASPQVIFALIENWLTGESL